MAERDPRDERVADLEREVAEANRALNEARREIADLKKVVEELLKRQRKGKRQANQFAREKGKKDEEKKKAGRGPGHEGDWRQTPDHVDDEVAARLDGCPFCGGEVCNVEELLQYVVDLPRCARTYCGSSPSGAGADGAAGTSGVPILCRCRRRVARQR